MTHPARCQCGSPYDSSSSTQGFGSLTDGRAAGRPAAAKLQPLRFAKSHHAFVILGRSKERSDAAQTLGSMPLPRSAAAVQKPLIAEGQRPPLSCRTSPPRGGRSAASRTASFLQGWLLAKSLMKANLPPSGPKWPQVGEMSGRTEGGAKDRYRALLFRAGCGDHPPTRQEPCREQRVWLGRPVPPFSKGEYDDISKQNHSSCRGVGYAGLAGAIPDEPTCARRPCAGSRFTAVARRNNRRLHAPNDA